MENLIRYKFFKFLPRIRKLQRFFILIQSNPQKWADKYLALSSWFDFLSHAIWIPNLSYTIEKAGGKKQTKENKFHALIALYKEMFNFEDLPFYFKIHVSEIWDKGNLGEGVWGRGSRSTSQEAKLSLAGGRTLHPETDRRNGWKDGYGCKLSL